MMVTEKRTNGTFNAVKNKEEGVQLHIKTFMDPQ